MKWHNSIRQEAGEEEHMTLTQQLVIEVWEGRREKDDEFFKALAAEGIPLSEFNRLGQEMRSVTRGKPRNMILTPTGGQPR